MRTVYILVILKYPGANPHKIQSIGCPAQSFKTQTIRWKLILLNNRTKFTKRSNLEISRDPHSLPGKSILILKNPYFRGFCWLISLPRSSRFGFFLSFLALSSRAFVKRQRYFSENREIPLWDCPRNHAIINDLSVILSRYLVLIPY